MYPNQMFISHPIKILMPPHSYSLTTEINATLTCVENETSADVHKIYPTKKYLLRTHVYVFPHSRASKYKHIRVRVVLFCFSLKLEITRIKTGALRARRPRRPRSRCTINRDRVRGRSRVRVHTAAYRTEPVRNRITTL